MFAESTCHGNGFIVIFNISGSHKSTATSEPVNTAYVFSRKDFSRQELNSIVFQ